MNWSIINWSDIFPLKKEIQCTFLITTIPNLQSTITSTQSFPNTDFWTITCFKILKDIIHVQGLKINILFRPINKNVRNFRYLAETKTIVDTFYNSFVPRSKRILNDLALKFKINPDFVINTSVVQFKNLASPHILKHYKPPRINNDVNSGTFPSNHP